MTKLKLIDDIAREIDRLGGRMYLVGGAVRDELLGIEVKDRDYEVFGLTSDQLVKVLEPHGRVDVCGRHFAVVKLSTGGQSYDFSLPRRETKTGRGHKAFHIQADPEMSLEDAASRRDFTFHAMSRDCRSESLLDPFGGRDDLRRGVLKAVGPRFSDDPLRVLRGFQFCARFELNHFDAKTVSYCRRLLGEFDSLPRERIWGEWKKWAVLGKRPSLGLEFLRITGWLEPYPELTALVDVPQDPKYHPEGDVWVHTGYVVDEAAALCDREGLVEDERLVVLLAALCHDLGKPFTTVIDGARVRSPRHAMVGLEPSEAFLSRIGAPRRVIERVLPLVREHLAHLNPVTPRSVRRLAVRLWPATLAELLCLIEADLSGRPPLPKGLNSRAEMIKQMAHEGEVTRGGPRPIVRGRDLLGWGFVQGPRIGDLLDRLYQCQLDGRISTLSDAKRWLREAGELD